MKKPAKEIRSAFWAQGEKTYVLVMVYILLLACIILFMRNVKTIRAVRVLQLRADIQRDMIVECVDKNQWFFDTLTDKVGSISFQIRK